MNVNSPLIGGLGVDVSCAATGDVGSSVPGDTGTPKDRDKIDGDILDVVERVIEIKRGYKLGPEYLASLKPGCVNKRS